MYAYMIKTRAIFNITSTFFFNDFKQENKIETPFILNNLLLFNIFQKSMRKKYFVTITYFVIEFYLKKHLRQKYLYLYIRVRKEKG